MQSPEIDEEPETVEEAVKYIIFLADADSLFNTALGLYDFGLVELIAQHSQKVRLSVIYKRAECTLAHVHEGS